MAPYQSWVISSIRWTLAVYAFIRLIPYKASLFEMDFIHKKYDGLQKKRKSVVIVICLGFAINCRSSPSRVILRMRAVDRWIICRGQWFCSTANRLCPAEAGSKIQGIFSKWFLVICREYGSLSHFLSCWECWDSADSYEQSCRLSTECSWLQQLFRRNIITVVGRQLHEILTRRSLFSLLKTLLNNLFQEASWVQ